MPRKALKPESPEQFKRFLEAAREIGGDPETETFDRVLEEVARSPRPKPAPKMRRPRKNDRGMSPTSCGPAVVQMRSSLRLRPSASGQEFDIDRCQ
jgi:hypothetical protein